VRFENTTLEIRQETQYPWSGKVDIAVSSTKEVPVVIKLRIPSWVRNEVVPGNLYSYLEEKTDSTVVRINGQSIEPPIRDGYLILEKSWKEDKISLEYPMTVRKVAADPRIAENQGKMALEYGPLVYAFEQVDQQADLDLLRISPSDRFRPKMENELLGGVVTLSNDSTKAVPYYSWSNRGIGKMKVWIPVSDE
jgi:DUF1680 family protein